jgi:Tfp pilus assembly protein PilX
MRDLRDEEGFVLASAIMLLMVILGLGLGLLLFTDNQQKASGREQASESAFNVAEGALNAQVGQISRSWPGAKPTPEEEVAACTATTSTATNGCPTAESMTIGYPNISPTACPAGGAKDVWGSATSNQWTTYVRDDWNKDTSFFNSAEEKLQPPYDANKDNKLWVRSVGVVQCRLVSVISLVSRQEVSANFPRTVMSANWFSTGNNGNGSEVIVDGRGEAPENGEISMRCTGFTEVSKCEQYREGQISNAKVNPPPGPPTPTKTTTELTAYRQMAESEHTYFKKGECPTGLPSGTLVYVEGPCAITGHKQEVGNSKAHPGFLIIANGTLEMDGQSEFWGVVYAVNQQNSSGIVVKVGANASLKGEIVIDGNGGIEVGENHQRNVVYDPTAAVELKVYAGATPTRNTFRVLGQSE